MNGRKQCPRCTSNETRFERLVVDKHYEYCVTCLNCGAHGPNDLSEDLATQSWNMRRRVHPSIQVDANAYEDLRNATPEELLEAVTWFYRQESTISAEEAEEVIWLLRTGFQLAQPGGWAHVAPMWLRESKKERDIEQYNNWTGATERVLFIEFATSENYEVLKPFAFVTSSDRRYDVDYAQDGTLVYHQCAYGQCYPICYLENCKHRYWAAENITVVMNSGEPAPPENRVELPVEYQGRFDEWPDMVEG